MVFSAMKMEVRASFSSSTNLTLDTTILDYH